MNLFEALKAEHTKISRLIRKLEDNRVSTPSQREALVEGLIIRIEALSKAMDDVLYPRLDEGPDIPDLNDLIDAAQDDISEIESTLDELARMDATDEHFNGTVAVLHTQVATYVQRQESELFPLAATIIPAEEAAELGEHVEREITELAHQMSLDSPA